MSSEVADDWFKQVVSTIAGCQHIETDLYIKNIVWIKLKCSKNAVYLPN